MTKLYCYLDETGQDTKGDLFLVSVVITEKEREALREELVKVEKASLKGRRKWMKTRNEQRLAYIRGILKIPALKGGLNYAVYHNTTDYLPRTVLTTARAITKYGEGDYKAVILVDGLRKSQTRWFGAELRHLHIRTEKVRGVRKEEAEPLMRLADAIAGFVRAAISGDKTMHRVLERAKRQGYIREL